MDEAASPSRIRESCGALPVIVVSRAANIDLSISALDKGAANFFFPPSVERCLEIAARAEQCIRFA